jgi:hypothetical protein
LVKEVKCPICQNDVDVRGKENPITCEKCGTAFNVVTLGVRMKIGGIPEEDFERLIKEYSSIGQYFMDRISQRFRRFYLIPKEKGICAVCKKEKNLVAESKVDGEKWCSSCLKSYLFGSIARKEILPGGKMISKIPLKTFVHNAFVDATSLFNAWLSNNWKKIVAKNFSQRKFKTCKEKGRDLEPAEEPLEIKEIRERWRKDEVPMSPFRFFLFYWLGRDISKLNRKKRRERLRQISETFKEKEIPKKIKEGIEANTAALKDVEKEIEDVKNSLKITGDPKRKRKIEARLQKLKNKRMKLKRKIRELEGKAKTTEIVRRIIAPICQGCENFREYDWGLECALDGIFERNRPAKIPNFPQNRVRFSKGMYEFERVEPGLWKIKIALWNRYKEKEALLFGTKWIEEYYKAENVFADTTRYPTLHSHIGKASEKEYIFTYPLTKVVPIKDEGWSHIVAYYPRTTCILSFKGEQRRVKFFRHSQIISIKDYYFKQREEAARGFFRKHKRKKEASKIRLILHNEAKEITKYLTEMPGKVTLLNIKKEPYQREEAQRRELNRKLGYWADGVFRRITKYKLELAGFPVEEKEFDATQIAICPFCYPKRVELGGSWQNLVIVEEKNSLKCNGCGREINTNLAIAMASILQVPEER